MRGTGVKQKKVSTIKISKTNPFYENSQNKKDFCKKKQTASIIDNDNVPKKVALRKKFRALLTVRKSKKILY